MIKYAEKMAKSAKVIYYTDGNSIYYNDMGFIKRKISEFKKYYKPTDFVELLPDEFSCKINGYVIGVGCECFTPYKLVEAVGCSVNIIYWDNKLCYAHYVCVLGNGTISYITNFVVK